jgi:hypothetical protein
MDSAYTAPPEVGRAQRPALIVGILFLSISIGGALASKSGFVQFLHSYLIGYIFWIGIALGCLAILMLQHISGGAWGLMIRRTLEAGTRTLPLMVVLFVPIALNVSRIYVWAGAEAANDKQISVKAGYLNLKFFLVRAIGYFAFWLVVTFLLNKWSDDQDRTSDRASLIKMQVLSAPAMVFFVLSVTFCTIDWVMSIDPKWSSTIFGLLFVAGWTLSALAFVIAVMVVLANRKPMAGVIASSHFHDLGKLLLAFVMVWAYFNFSQFLIIWSGNIPEEASWYLARMKGGWGYVGVALVLLHFALPFVLLLSRDLKRNANKLAMVAVGVLAMRFVDVVWLIAPTFTQHSAHEGFNLSWMDIAVPIGIGGIWLFVFLGELQKRPLLPFNDPYLPDALERGEGGH